MIAIAAFGVALLAFALLKNRPNRVALICLAIFFLVLDLLMASALYKWIDYTMHLKFALGIGGTAIASFVFGIIVYNTLRVAAALPIVILMIGLAAFPSGFAGGPDIRAQIIIWMGGILGIATVTEGVTQALRIRGAATIKTEVVKANPADDLAAAHMSRALTGDLANIGGDLSPAMGPPPSDTGR